MSLHEDECLWTRFHLWGGEALTGKSEQLGGEASPLTAQLPPPEI